MKYLQVFILGFFLLLTFDSGESIYARYPTFEEWYEEAVLKCVPGSKVTTNHYESDCVCKSPGVLEKCVQRREPMPIPGPPASRR